MKSGRKFNFVVKIQVVLCLLLFSPTACSTAEETTQSPTKAPPTTVPVEATLTETPTATVPVSDKKKTAQAKAATMAAETALAPDKTQLPTITRHPTITPTFTPTAWPIWEPGWEPVEIRSLCLSIRQEYPEFEAKQNEPIEEALAAYLAEIGVELRSDPQNCDASLDVDLSGTTVASQYYVSGGTRQCYSGSFYQGEMQLTSQATTPLAVPIHHMFIPDVIGTCHEEPDKDINWTHGWKAALLDGIGQIWGKDSLLRLMIDPRQGVQCSAAEVLWRWENLREDLDAQDVPVLLTQLKSCTSEISYLFQALGAEAWDAIPTLLAVWGEYEENTNWAIHFNDALRKITETYQPLPRCNDLSCWQSWWGAGKPAP
jgi:hypothetical protein